MLKCGSMTFMLRPGRMYPPHDSHESVRYWNAGWFYEKNVSVPEIHDGLPKFNNEPPEELASWSFVPSLSLTPILEKAARRISWLVHDGLTGTQLTLSWFTRRIQPLRTLTTAATRTTSQEPITKYMKKSPAVGPTTPAPRFPHCSTAISSSGGTISPSCRKHSTGSNSATTSSELENLRSSYQELETKLMERSKKESGAGNWRRKTPSSSGRRRILLKRNADSETIKRQQKELNGLRKFMETAEHHWDLLAENILEPLGYSERRRNKFSRDDVLSLAGDDCKDLISASRKICHNLSLKKSRTCGLRKLVKKMDILPELVTDLQASSARARCHDFDYVLGA
ncbi:hypothetical protein QYE76_041136 [Lolium multiflorum]|uniref:Uncharacterized protein n=1 Tax=Lolium multiflorum TaxID=4521 RepID=A0AAD8TEQ2_LOLMU|nr:hypothetical protein QYE76_041136 [Lolium multiflorum]